MKKTATAVAIVLMALVVGMLEDAAAVQLLPGGTFVDDNGSIHEGAIEAINLAAITRGCNPPDNDRYCPDNPVTRGEMAAFLVRALDLPGTAEDFFTDDEDSIFENDINRLAAAGITKGCNPPANDRYCPESKVTRGQMAAFLVRAFDYTDTGAGNLFTDDDGLEFEGDIDRLGAAGVTKGCNPPENDRFCPGEPVLRDQMASFLTRALGLTPITPPPPPPPPPDPEVFTIGDSVMRGVACNPSIPPCYSPAMNLEDEIPNLTSDAKVSRSFSSADEVLSSWLARGNDPDVVVVHLGTNGPPSASQFDDIMAVAGSDRRVIFMTVKLDRSWESASNRAIRSNAVRFTNAEVADWWAFADPHSNWFTPDTNCGCHLWTTAARAGYVGFIEAAVTAP